MKRMWMVRAGEEAYLIEDFISREVVSMGWNDVGSIESYDTKDDLKEEITKKYPRYKVGKVRTTAGQLYKFANEIQKGDYVVSYNPDERIYHIGEVISEYQYKESDYDHYHILEVQWEKTKDRDELSTSSKNTLGAISTIFEIKNPTKQELLNKKSNDSNNTENDDEEEYESIKENVEEQAREFIKDKVLSLDWEEMQELVAGILRGMGYKTRISPKGPDRGRDIIASPDGLGLEEPRIIVEVKHRSGSMGADKIRSFTGGLRTGDKGLYVSTGGFSKEAKYEAERSNIPVTLIDSDELVRLIGQYYDYFDSDTKALVPLKKIYWPV